MEELQGGREGLIFLSDEKVYRPTSFWSESVHNLLLHLESKGFYNAPKFLGFADDGNEVLSFVLGDVYNYPLKGNIATDDALISASKLLRQYHDSTVSFITSPLFEDSQWMLPSRAPYEVICHGDFAPYNVALDGVKTIGLFDFDTAHPAPRLWDIAYAIYCWAPFKTNQYDALGDLRAQSIRARLFCDGYGLPNKDRGKLVETMINRIQTLVDFMQSEASKGNVAFIENIDNGHHLAYLTDIEYLKTNSQFITNSLYK
ncbi:MULTISPECIES: phosphotransferase [unclassified Photobacterium]|uniref:phosphotransferase n=1 Tax=unclassified Photobacterium TaxID=2628852 RepID=UPI001EDD2715|nr:MULTISPECIES: phosphotransferase [unclassified Photobacterium]MCG3863686.1 aminoglycoside phosphotransferase family protein [Photobacterium sp. Ph6]MCG3875214.1 aminoglycoside phosphotransferase family protein [Photobacterium sp. Ph5]